jgi:hypothetical protein
VVLREVASLPRSAELVSGGVLSVGEATDHSHRFVDGGSFALWEKHGRRFVEVMKPATLIHEELNPLLSAGNLRTACRAEFDYSAVKERSAYSPAVSSVRTVRD